MQPIIDFLTMLVLVILAISTVVSALDFIGFLPMKVKKSLRMSKVQDTIDVLKELGVDIDKYKRSIISTNYPKEYDSEQSIEKAVMKSLNPITIHKKIVVGQNRATQLKSYIDLIGYSCDRKHSKHFSSLLSTYWAYAVKNKSLVVNPDFDYVVTPKGGSPILGYEFANLIGKPFVLHELRPRFIDNDDDFRYVFNCAGVPPTGSRFLIVDDSVTGAAMMLNLVGDLRSFGYEVTDSLVVFELTNKDGRQRLYDQGVNLISLVKVQQ